jgi:SM-20-related protein
MTDVLTLEGFLEPAACAALRAELRKASGAAAGLLGGDPHPLVRKATRLAVSAAARASVRSLLMRAMPALERHFGVSLTHFEAPQFLRYEAGDFFVAHQDGNTPLIHDDSRFRRVSVVLFLSRQSEEPAPETYGGGALVLYEHWSRPDVCVPLAPAPGTLVAFRAETTHEVTPVAHGERYTIVTWYR